MANVKFTFHLANKTYKLATQVIILDEKSTSMRL